MKFVHIDINKRAMNCNCGNAETVSAVVLAGSRDFGRCPIASRLPVALWPVLGQSALERVVRCLNVQGIRDACVCSEEDAGYFKSLSANASGMTLKFFEESLRVGTAGCIRDALSKGSEGLIVVLPAAIVRPPDVKELVCAHIEQKAGLTAVLNPGCEETLPPTSSGIYICSRAVMEHIPDEGYCDIKEWLIPELLRCGKVVKTLELSRDIGNFRDGQGYLRAMADYLGKEPPLDVELPSLRRRDSQCLWVDDSAEVDSSARFFGPVIIMAGAQIDKGAVVFGPGVVGRNCRVGRGSVVLNSVLWDSAKIGANCEVRNCLLDYDVNVEDNTVVQNRAVAFAKTSALVSLSAKVSKLVRNNFVDLRGWSAATLRGVSAVEGTSKATWFAGIIIVAAFLWSYWPCIIDLWNIWMRSDEYSSGLLVPFLAGYILWSRREQLKDVPIKPSLLGIIVLLFAEGLRLFGLFFMYSSAERLSVVVCIAALVLFLLGWRFFKKTATILLFLCLMLPWPNRVQAAVALPLQRWATSSAVFCLETIGYDVTQEGNIIHIGQANVAVAEACNGLRMVTAFFVIGGLVVLLMRRQWWEKLVVLASSLPIAILCNTTRLALTAMAFTILQGDYWEKIFHDFGGYAMMPAALAMVVAELWLLQRLTSLPGKREPIIITRS